MKLRKLFSNGTSILIAIPPEFLRSLHVDAGDYLKIELGRGNTIHLSKLYDQSTKLAKTKMKGALNDGQT